MDTPGDDHDLLIELNANVKNLNSTFLSYTGGATATSNDHEARLRVLEAENQQLRGSQKSQKWTITIISVVGGSITVVLALVQFVGR